MKLTINPYSKIQENKTNSRSPILLNTKNFLEASVSISEIEKKDNSFETINSRNFESISINEQNSMKRDEKNVIAMRIKKKLTKDDLNYIPLPIFSCIYCSNEKIVYKHLINENLSKNYYLQTSINDIKILDKAIASNFIFVQDKLCSSLCKVILNNSEYIMHYYNRKELNNTLYSNIIHKYLKANTVTVKNYFIQKLKSEYIKKRNQKFEAKNISKQFLKNKEEKLLLKPIDNNIFNQKNIFKKRNCKSKIKETNLSQNSILVSLSENNQNDLNKYLNFNTKKINKILRNKEYIYRKERKNLDILNKGKIYLPNINNNKIIFDSKIYDIWNPNITSFSEENEEIKNKDYFYNINGNRINKKINFAKVKKKLLKLNFNINEDKNENSDKLNYNNINISNKEITKEAKFFTNNNMNKRNLLDFINIEKRNDIKMTPLLFNNHFSTGMNNNFDKNNNMINKIYPSRNFIKNGIHLEQNSYKNLSNLNDKKYYNYYLKKLKSKSSSYICNFYRFHKNKEISSKCFDINLNDEKYKNKNFDNKLILKSRYALNLDIEQNNIKKKILSKYFHFPSKSIINNSSKRENCFKSLPNLNSNLSCLKLKRKNKIKKINSNRFLPKRSSSISYNILKEIL